MPPPGNGGRRVLLRCFGEDSWDAGSTSETYGPGTLPDRGPVGIESETTQTGRLRHPAGGALLTRGSQIPASSVACATCGKRHIACKRPHEEHQFRRDNFRDALLPLATAARIYRSRGGGRGRLECSYGCGQHDKRSRVAAFQLSLRQRKHNLPDQLRVHPRSDRNEIA